MNATEELRHALDEQGIEWDKLVSCPIEIGTARYNYYSCSCADGLDRNLSVQANLTSNRVIKATQRSKVTGETSDGYHTLNELYHHRAVLFSVIVHDHQDLAWKSKLHYDGTMYDGMFIVGIDTPQGQATYHYNIDPYWDMFDCKELDRAPEWDGHTSDEAIERIATLRQGAQNEI